MHLSGGYITLAAWGPQRLKAGDTVTSAPPCSPVATKPLPLGVPNALQRGTESSVALKWATWLHSPSCLGGPQGFAAGDKIISAPHWAGYSPCRSGGPQRFKVEDKVKSGEQLG